MQFYDHALNHSNAAEATAIARCRQDVIGTDRAYRVEANWPGQDRFWWNGGQYDCLALAKTLITNRAMNVILTDPTGQPVPSVTKLHF